MSRNGATFCVLPDPFQGVRSGTNFDRPLRRFVHSLRTKLVGRPHVGRLMAEGYSWSHHSLIAGQRPHCPKCGARMRLARVALGPSGFDVRTFDCAKCDHAHIATVATDLVSDSRSLRAKSIDALEEAQEMPPGARRTEALKKAGLLSRTADDQGVIFAKRGRPRKR